MPNVLILGAGGYVAQPLAQSLVRSGNYHVFGLVRRQEQAKLLTQNEIFPIVADAGSVDIWSKVIEEHDIDVIVDCASAYEHAGAILDTIIAAAKKRSEILQKEGFAAPKLGFVYTSGTWVHGSPSQRVNDLSPVGTSLSRGTPNSATAWRTAHEQRILAARDVLDVAIVRPALVYGRGGWIWAPWWTPVLEARTASGNSKIQLPAPSDARPGLVHVDDVVSGLHLAIDRIDGRLGTWPVFDLITETCSVTQIIEAFKQAVGVKAEVEYVGPGDNAFYQALGTRTNNDGGRATSVLGWQPKIREFLMKMPIYAAAFEASQGTK